MNKIIESVLETAHDLHEIKLINLKTLREIENICMPPAIKKEITASEIKEIRQKNNMSQGLFAKVMNVTASTIHQWEHGKKQPSGTALRLLDVLSRKGIEALV